MRFAEEGENIVQLSTEWWIEWSKKRSESKGSLLLYNQ